MQYVSTLGIECAFVAGTLEPLVVAIKEATGNLQRASQIIAKVGDRLVLLSGDDATTLALRLLGLITRAHTECPSTRY